MKNNIRQAGKFIKDGGVVCFPTETVYALACDPGSDNAIKRIYALKNRDINVPLALLTHNIDQIKNIVNLSERALKIIEKFCPGPLTIILPIKNRSLLCDNFNKGYDTVAVRIPDHAIALDILNEVNHPLVATSVNPSGESPAINNIQVKEYFASGIDFIVEGEESQIGIASTIIDLSSDEMKMVREGAITEPEIRSL